jgi:hypothetical protein
VQNEEKRSNQLDGCSIDEEVESSLFFQEMAEDVLDHVIFVSCVIQNRVRQALEDHELKSLLTAEEMPVPPDIDLPAPKETAPPETPGVPAIMKGRVMRGRRKANEKMRPQQLLAM